MSLINRGVLPLALVLVALTAAGCESVALVGRPTLEAGQDELVAEVERLDIRSREIHLRPNSGRTRVVGYSDGTRVIYRGREYPVNHLEAGDVVAMQLKQDSHGNPYTDLIRVQDSIRDRSRASAIRPGTRIQTLDGTVEQVDQQRGVFEIREQSGDKVMVSLPYNARRADIDRVQRLRNGDYVKVEGRFINRDRFELEAFL